MEEKSCKLCSTVKPVSEFRKIGGVVHAWCLMCYRQYCKSRYASRKKSFSKPEAGQAALLCSVCNEEKDSTEFSLEPSTSRGFNKNCKPCALSLAREWRSKTSAKSLISGCEPSPKPCNKCLNVKDFTCFYVDLRIIGGRSSTCIECMSKSYVYIPEIQSRYIANHKNSFPDRAHARQLLSSAVRYGRITRQPCERCGSIKSQGHHEDYSKPLDVIWLCRKHHAERHIEIKREIALRSIAS